jgi:adenosylhomocysteine nucleosidase
MAAMMNIATISGLQQSPLLVFALEAESQGLFDGHPILYSGVGKVNAAYHLTRAIAQQRPSCVVNLGSAGSTHFSTGTIVNCTGFVARDMDCTALGTPLYATPFDDMPPLLRSGGRVAAFPDAVCGSGDSFVTDGKETPWRVVDMEAYALAKICALEEIPFFCLKYITDGADGGAAQSWEAGLMDAAQGLKKAYDCMFVTTQI